MQISFESSGSLLEWVIVASWPAITKDPTKKVLIGRQPGGFSLGEGGCRIRILRTRIDNSPLIELVVEVDFAPLYQPPEVNDVFPFLPSNIIGIHKIASREY